MCRWNVRTSCPIKTWNWPDIFKICSDNVWWPTVISSPATYNSEFLAITCSLLKAQKKSHVQGAIGFGFIGWNSGTRYLSQSLSVVITVIAWFLSRRKPRRLGWFSVLMAKLRNPMYFKDLLPVVYVWVFLLQTGPKGVIQDYRRYKQLETEQRKEKQKEMKSLAQKFSVSCQSSVRHESRCMKP